MKKYTKHTLHSLELIREQEKKLREDLEIAKTMPPPKIYTDLLLVEKALKDSGTFPWYGSMGASPWQELVENILCYKKFHAYPGQKTFGKQFLDTAITQYPSTREHYEVASNNNATLMASLEVLKTSILQEMQVCEQKLQNNK